MGSLPPDLALPCHRRKAPNQGSWLNRAAQDVRLQPQLKLLQSAEVFYPQQRCTRMVADTNVRAPVSLVATTPLLHHFFHHLALFGGHVAEVLRIFAVDAG